MSPRPFALVCRWPTRRPALLSLIAALFCLAGGVRTAFAQSQESGLLDRINHPDRTLAFPLSNKNFNKTAAFQNKEASIKSFILSKDATTAGDSAFHARTFDGSSAYRSKAFDVRDGAAAGQKTFAQNKLFDTKGYDVRDARDAGKSLAVSAYDLHDPYTLKGKRQDTYDELLKRKKLSIEEVRELLNKNK